MPVGGCRGCFIEGVHQLGHFLIDHLRLICGCTDCNLLLRQLIGFNGVSDEALCEDVRGAGAPLYLLIYSSFAISTRSGAMRRSERFSATLRQ